MGETLEDVFFRLHAGLAREAPGSSESTRRALAFIEARTGSRVLDVGCGPGPATLELARRFPARAGGRVVGVDLHAPYLRELLARAEARGLGGVSAVRADMARLPFPEATFDLIWSEGAVYHLGFEAGLAAWRRHLRPGGWLAVTELSWLASDPPEETARFWAEAYPGLRDVAANVAAAERVGFEPVETFALPEEDWWREYYAPLEERVRELERSGDETEREVAAMTRAEIELYRAHPDAYGYVFYVMRRSEDRSD